jgi:cyclic pyranopterin phosphate synthase
MSDQSSAGHELTHVDARGQARMVDVGDKTVTDRRAVAEAVVLMSDETLAKLFDGDLPKGDALGTARLAGIMGAKKTSELIPLCHPLSISGVTVEIERIEGGARIESAVRTTDRTGVEMEALTAASIAALTLYDMIKAVERTAQIGAIRLLSKTGGKSDL